MDRVASIFNKISSKWLDESGPKFGECGVQFCGGLAEHVHLYQPVIVETKLTWQWMSVLSSVAHHSHKTGSTRVIDYATYACSHL